MMRRLKAIVSWIVGFGVDVSDCVLTRRFQQVDSNQALAGPALVRWGDGETALALGRSTGFQKADPVLAMELRTLLRAPTDTLLLCFPPSLMRPAPFSGTNRENPVIWALTAAIIRAFFRASIYGDAFMFREESGQAAIEGLRDLINHSAVVAVISSDETKARAVLDQLSPTKNLKVEHRSVAKIDAYSEKHRIMSWIRSIESPDVILFSAGPVGKVLIHELAAGKGTTARLIDIGHFFDHFPAPRSTN